jgi:TatD DNase family protein
MQLVDTHCHIQSIDATKGERHTRELWAKADDLTADKVIQDAVEAGVAKMICVGCDLEDSELAISFAGNHSECWASIGLHPHEAQHYVNDEHKLQKFCNLVKKPKVIAIGECGLDYYYEHSPKEAQVSVLKFQLQLAKDNDLPVIFHVREAFNDFWPIYDQYKLKGVLHSFTDNKENLQKAVERGLYIGVNGIASFIKQPGQLEMYKNIPLEHLLLETDAPFLTPTPYRGTINEPKQTRVVGEFVADLRSENFASLAAATTSNAHELFGI